MTLRLGSLALCLALVIGFGAGQQVQVASAADPSVTLTAIGAGGKHQLPDGAFTVTSDCVTGVDTRFNEEYRVALEFDLSGIPAGAMIQAATLRLRAANFNLSGTTAIYGYAGSGAIEAGDMTAGSLAVTYTPSTPSPEFVDVTAAVLTRWQNSQRWAGFNLRQEPLGSSYGSWDCPGYFSQPLLIITYRVSDSTPPVITPTVNGTLGTNDWYVSNVSLTWSVTDNESSIASQTGCDAQNVTTDTTGITFTCVATSTGGTDSKSVTIKRDATAPIVASATPERAANSAGWYNAPLKVTFDGLDATSGIASCTSPTYSGPDNASANVSGTCVDNAGNISSPVGFGLNYDATAPTGVTGAPTTSPNAAGWFKSALQVQFSGTDATSGIASCSLVSYSGPDNAAAAVNGTCTDNAGNTSTSASSAAFKFDATPPTLAPSISPNPASLNQPATATANASDATSGVASQSCATPSTSSAGSQSVSCSASDNAGNTNTANASYTVINNAPTIAVAPAGACLSDGAASGRINLSVNDANTGTNGLTLSLLSNSNPSLVPNKNVTLSGSGANRTLQVTAASKKAGTAVLTIGVSDGVNTTSLAVTVFVGSDGNETINGTAGTDLIFGLNGTNTINGLDSNDLLCGGNGVDTLYGGEGDDTLNGNRGADILNGENGNDQLTGGQAGDRFSGGSGTDNATDFTPSQGDTQNGTVETFNP